MRRKMLDKYPVCQGCGKSWSEVTHQAKGLCRGCYRKQQYKDNNGDKSRTKWAKDFDRCQECGTTEVIHTSNGLCRSCASIKHRGDNLEHYHQVEEIRRMQPHVVAYMRAYMAKYYPANKHRWKNGDGSWIAPTPEVTAVYNEKYRTNNREKCRESYRKWHEANPGVVAARGKKWREENPERKRELDRNRRMRLAGLEGSFTEDEFADLCEAHNFQCYHCGCEPTDDNPFEPDHLVPVKNTVEGIIPSNDIDNIGPLCKKCNNAKTNRPLFDFDLHYLELRAQQLIEGGKTDHCIVQLFHMTLERKVQ